MNLKLNYKDCIDYCGFDQLPVGIEEKYDTYEPDHSENLINRDFLYGIFEQYHIPKDKKELLLSALEEIEKDSVLFYFTKFLIDDMCSARNRCDEDFYTNLTPGCMKKHGDLYSFLLLLSCVIPSMKLMESRGIPKEYYEKIPHQPIKNQLEKLVKNNDTKVSDFPWDMNFYTCSIFLLDRFFFIPYRFEDDFTMFRNKKTNKVIALRHAGEEFRRDGQRDGINDVFDKSGKFTSVWNENEDTITANRVNPMGFVEKETTTIMKKEWDIALEKGDTLLAFHIPSGPGYTPERVKNSMKIAIDFYQKYFPELPIKGFWSESWLYDTRLSLILNENSNIVQVQRQFYNYPILEGDSMLRYEAFGDWKSDPGNIPLKTSLQKAAAEYMKSGKRFNTLSMIVIKEDVDKIGSMPYITNEDMEHFKKIVDSHLQ